MTIEQNTNTLETLIKKYGKLQEKYQVIGGYQTQEKFSKICSKFNINELMLNQNYNNLSGGEKARLLLIKLIQKDINFLILDEPTNHIDIDTRELLEEALNEYSGTVLFVSHDRFFINKLANRFLNIEDFKIKSYYGNYDDFIKRKNM